MSSKIVEFGENRFTINGDVWPINLTFKGLNANREVTLRKITSVFSLSTHLPQRLHLNSHRFSPLRATTGWGSWKCCMLAFAGPHLACCAALAASTFFMVESPSKSSPSLSRIKGWDEVPALLAVALWSWGQRLAFFNRVGQTKPSWPCYPSYLYDLYLCQSKLLPIEPSLLYACLAVNMWKLSGQFI